MSVEIAVRREMECRRRVESILQPNKETANLLPFQSSYPRKNDQAPSGDRKLKKQILEREERSTPNQTNRNFPRNPWQRSNLQIHEKRQKGPMFHPRGFLSRLKPNNKPYAASTSRGISAANRLRVLANSISNPRPSLSDQAALNGQKLFCEVCKVYCWTPFNLKQHLSGHKHGTKLKGENHPICELCEIWCTDESSLQMHYNGRKHKAKMLDSRVLDQMKMDA